MTGWIQIWIIGVEGKHADHLIPTKGTQPT